MSKVIGTDEFTPLFDRLCEDRRYVGYRLSGREGDTLTEAFYRDLRRTAKAGRTVDILAGGYTLDDVSAIAKRVPDLKIILDHFGNVVLDGKPLDPAWVESFCAYRRAPERLLQSLRPLRLGQSAARAERPRLLPTDPRPRLRMLRRRPAGLRQRLTGHPDDRRLRLGAFADPRVFPRQRSARRREGILPKCHRLLYLEVPTNPDRMTPMKRKPTTATTALIAILAAAAAIAPLADAKPLKVYILSR
ncbi:MAG: hypothetical protein R3F11_15360 [Verrucomicrobiales bacterium]